MQQQILLSSAASPGAWQNAGQPEVTYQMLLPGGLHFFNYLKIYSDYKLLEGENHQLYDSGP